MATKAQLAKAAADLKKAQANLAKVSKPNLIPGFKPAVKIPTPTKRPGDPGFVGPTAVATPTVPQETAFIFNNQGLVEEVYTSGPKAGTSVITGALVLQGPKPADTTAARADLFSTLTAGSGVGSGAVVTTGGGGTVKATTSVQLIRAKLKELNFPDSIIDGSINFVEAAMDDGIEMANAIDLLYNNKEYTTRNGVKLTSPFYTEFTSLKENYKGDPRFTPTPKELMEFSLGVKSLVSRYGRSSKFAERTALEQYVANGVRITDLDNRFATAALKTLEADPNEVKTLIALGFINNTEDLADFYLDPKIGQEQFEINAKTAAFGKQALKRAGSGITFDAARIKQLSATTSGVADAEATAAQGFETIANTLQPLTKLEQIYGVGIDQKAIQTQLEEEQFRGTASELRKRRKEQEELAFQRRSGTIGATRGSGGSLGTRSTLGTI
jgi:hypothetical protein